MKKEIKVGIEAVTALELCDIIANYVANLPAEEQLVKIDAVMTFKRDGTKGYGAEITTFIGEIEHPSVH